jgi:TolA-binding protein
MAIKTDKQIEKLSEQQAKNEKQISEQQEKTDKQIEKLSKQQEKTDKQISELTYNVDGIGKSNGEMAEQTIYNALKRDMTFAGIKFDDLLPKAKRHSSKLNLEGQYDAVLVNGKEAAVFEIKYKVRPENVVKLATKQLESFRMLYPEYKDYEIILGVGGMSFEDGALEEAEARGIGIIRVIGEKVEYQTDNIRKY